MTKAKEAAAPPTQMATQEPGKEAFDTLRGLLERSKSQIEKAMPEKLDVDRTIRTVLTTCQRSPGLLNCHPMSIVGCTMLASELGLELSGPLGQAYMVPRRNKHAGNRMEATFQIGYRGLYRLAYNSGKVSSFQPRVVHSNDAFKIRYGSDAHIEHEPTTTGEAGVVVGYYCIVNMLPTGQDFEFMTYQQMLQHRKRYSADSKIWDDHFEAMALKTVARKLCKRLPVSTALVTAAMLDEYGEAGVTVHPRHDDTAGATAARLTALKERLAEGGMEGMVPDEAAPASTPTPDAPPASAQPVSEAGRTDPNAKCSEATKSEIAKLFERSRWTAEVRQSFLKKWSTGDMDDFTELQGNEVIQQLLRAIGGAK